MERMTPVRRRRPATGDDGFALVTVLLTMVLLAAFSLVALQQTISGTASARKDQDWVAALAAAQAGVDDYVSRLNDSNGAYYLHTPTSTPLNPAMGFSSPGVPTWADVPVAGSGSVRGSYHYDVDTSTFTGTSSVTANGNIAVTSTGKVGKRTRTITSYVRRSGFVDYVYFTDFEVRDPLDYPASQRATAQAHCANYHWLRTPPTGFSCQDIRFSNDLVDGPVHSNDAIMICNNVTFKDVVTTMAGPVASNGGKHYRTDGCASTSGTTFARPDDPRQVKKVNLPSTNLGLKAETSAAASPPGCLYVGPTKISIKGNQLHVTSPWTRAPTAACPVDAWFPLPVNGVVYVDVVPADGLTTNPNSWPATQATKDKCPALGNGLGFPVPGETDSHYPCRAGDVFVEQVGGLASNGLNGRLTVSANNNLYVTSHLDYAPGTADRSFLGLIAEQFLYVHHPVKRTGTSPTTGDNLPGSIPNARISAALLSVNHSVMVQNPDMGVDLGTLTITGAITQKYRGVVGDTNASNGSYTGYGKKYVYDQRLAYDSPPKFLNPLVSSFNVVRTAEVKPAYR